MKTIEEIQTEVHQIIRNNQLLPDRIQALKDAGYDNINLHWVKTGGLGLSTHLKKKKVWRIQISYQHLEKNYPAAYCLDINDSDVIDFVEQPF
jgi:hypothetical protein